jgi:hypothetical protein
MASIWMDLFYADDRQPRRGDRLRTTRTTYYVLAARMVKRKDPNACRRVQMNVRNMDELSEETRKALLRSAMRRGSSQLYYFRWYPREKKKITFEQYVRGA